MIVISPGLVLSETPSLNVNNPLIGWQNIITRGMLVADEESADYPVTNLANPATFLPWQGLTTAAQSITTNINTVEDVDYVGIAGHNFGSSQISVELEGTSDGVSWSQLIPPTMLGDDSPAILRFDPQALVSVRLNLGSGAAVPRAAAIYCGKLLVLQRRLYVGHAPMKYNRRTRVTNGRSETGQFLGRIVTGAFTSTSVSLQNLTATWFRANMVKFLETAQEEPFFFAWRPGSYPREVGYAVLMNDPEPVNDRGAMMSLTLELSGII